jgi:O-antigen/teichoic acid export membrane protein
MRKKKVYYTASKYVTYGFKFLQSMVIAKYLGPAGLAVYGFAQLIALYISFLHFGIPFSIHTLLSISKNEEREETITYISDGFWFLVFSGIFFCIAGGILILFNPSLFQKFEFSKYGIMSIVIGINLFIVQFFANIYQVYAQYARVAVNELIGVVLVFVVIFLNRNNESGLLYYTLLVSACCIVINLFFFLYKAPFKILFSIRRKILSTLFEIGIPMLISNVGFYLITISVRTIATYYYSLHEIGLFTFAISISNSVMMGLNAIGWTYYSTVLANTSGDIDDAYQYVKKVNRVYNFVLCVTVFAGILLLPFLFYFLPAYKEFYNGITILLLSQIFLSVSFGYSSLLIAQNKQKALAWISFSTLALVILFSSGVCFFNLSFVYQPVVILLGMFFYSFQICQKGAKLCNKNFAEVFFAEVLNYKILVPVLLWVVFVMSGISVLWGLIAASIFIVLSYKDLSFLLTMLGVGKKELNAA